MKVSQIKYRNLLFSKNKEKIIEAIVFKNSKEIKNKCDIGIIFGGTLMIPNRVDAGIKLYKEGLIDKILLTGGIGFFNRDKKVPESIKMLNYLLTKGIPIEDIILEDKSRNTYENVINSLKIISDKYDIDKISLLLITSEFHIRRCLGMISKKLQKENINIKPVYDGKYDRVNWKKTTAGRQKILYEAMFICHYVKSGKILDYEITIN